MFCMCRAMFEGSSGTSTGTVFSSSSGAVAGDVCRVTKVDWCYGIDEVCVGID